MALRSPYQHAYQPPVESRLVRTLLAGEFALSAEIVPPSRGDAEKMLGDAERLDAVVDGINIADSAGGKMRMSGLACAALFKQRGFEPILQMTCRDRNRIALYSDLLGAAGLGVHNLLMLRGDPIDGAVQQTTTVLEDLAPTDLIAAAAELSQRGVLPGGALDLTPAGLAQAARPAAAKFFVGAADVPTKCHEDWWEKALRDKIAAGAQFVQTQLCYNVETVYAYAERLQESDLADKAFVLVGTGPLRSAKSALWMRNNLWGVDIPDSVIARLETARNPVAEGIDICVELLDAISRMPALAGAHLMAPNNFIALVEVAKLAGIVRHGRQSA